MRPIPLALAAAAVLALASPALSAPRQAYAYNDLDVYDPDSGYLASRGADPYGSTDPMGGTTYSPYGGGRAEGSPVPRETVAFDPSVAPGTIVVSNAEKRLYFVTARGEAIRYGVGVGRPGFGWTGVHTVTAKREWPSWTPPAEMLARRPDLPRHMAGGIENPLGARAMYLGSTLYRIHGSNEPESIGTNVSSGCIRMVNEDVVDLYDRVTVGTKVVVR